MRIILIIPFLASLPGCGGSTGTDYSSSTTASDTGSSRSTPETYESAKDADKAIQDKQNQAAYETMRRSGLSQTDAAEAVDAVRDLCPHSDADGQCD
jgi:hypothetical protein